MSNLEVIERDGFRWYPIDGKEYVSVTTALGWVFHYTGWAKFDMSSPFMLTALKRGRAVHKAAYWLSMGRRLKMETVDPIILPFVLQFEDFLKTTRFVAEAAEFRVYSEKYGYAGRGDIKGHFPGDPDRHFLDVKTGVGVEEWLAGYQIAAYLRAHREMGGDLSCAKRSALHLNGKAPDKWRLRGLTEPDDLVHFLSALNCFKAAERHKAL